MAILLRMAISDVVIFQSMRISYLFNSYDCSVPLILYLDKESYASLRYHRLIVNNSCCFLISLFIFYLGTNSKGNYTILQITINGIAGTANGNGQFGLIFLYMHIKI